jgi:hypothetical protein
MDERLDRATVIPVDNETESTTSRVTVEGRTITYKLHVLQQPVRARACGQGAKSSADRRPVDPPPIVQLQIFEGDNQKNDITFTMHANYFLFATLEHARPMAHGRVPPERTSHPVLTGTPVAGMVYLDRPEVAGYFIFPDLSVRHEGKYRLSFSLYEELKNTKDDDRLADDAKPNAAGDAHVTHRLEVKSAPFQVYSAKKFPGLTESTALSRLVAEQGCRVRIRRDVRMRRHEGKSGGKEWEGYEDETAPARARMASATPDPNMYPQNMHTPHGYMDPIPRPRSASNASHHSLGPPISRRPSTQEMNAAYQQPQYGGATPHTPQSGGYSSSSQYGPSPTQAFSSAPYVQHSAMRRPPPQYSSNFAPPPPPSAPQQQSYYNYAQPPPVQPQQQQQHYPTPPTYEQASSGHSAGMDQTDYRKGSVQHATLPPPPPSGQSGYAPVSAPSYPSQAGTSQQAYHHPNEPSHQHSYSASSSVDMSNTRSTPTESHARHGSNTPLSGRNYALPPLQTSSSTMIPSNKLEPSSPGATTPQSSYFSNPHHSADTHKRSFGNVFSDRHHQQPLRHGARPPTMPDYSITTGASLSAVDEDDSSSDLDPNALSMHYRRADGRQIRRALPGQS